MAISLMRDDRTYTGATAQVGGIDSYQTGYPFANCTLYRDKPWLEWRSGFSDQNIHTLAIAKTAASSTAIGFFGCNFSSVIVDGTTRTLGYNRTAGDYRGIFSCTLFSNETFTIPIQTTVEGYFKCRAIVLSQWSTISGFHISYPLEHEIDQNAIDLELESGATIRSRLGDRKQVIRISCNPNLAGFITTYLQMLNTSSRETRIMLRETTQPIEHSYYCRRDADFECVESAYLNYKMSLLYREI